MATDREIGDLVARFRLIVDEQGVKKASGQLDLLEGKVAKSTPTTEKFGASVAGLAGKLQTAAIGITAVAGATAAVTKAFLDAGNAGELEGADLDRFYALDGALSELKDTALESAIAIGSDLAPTLASLADIISALAPAINFVAEALVSPFETLGEVWTKLVGDGNDLETTLRQINKQNEIAAKRADEVAKRVSEEEAAFRKLIDAQVDQLEAELRVESAELSLEDARREAADAQAELNDIVNRSGDYLLKEADALDAVGDAQRKLNNARFAAMRLADDLGEAQAALAEAQFRYGSQSSEADEAADTLQETQHRLDEANRDVAEGTEDVADKQRRYREALEAGGPASKEAKEAAERLERAQFRVKQELLQSATASVDLAEKQGQANSKLQTGAERAEAFRQKLQEIKDLSGDPQFAANLDALSTRIANILAGGTATGAVAPNPVVGAIGGPAPNNAGTSGSAAISQIIGSTVPGVTQNISINVTGPLSPDTVGQIGSELEWAGRTVIAR